MSTDVSTSIGFTSGSTRDVLQSIGWNNVPALRVEESIACLKHLVEIRRIEALHSAGYEDKPKQQRLWREYRATRERLRELSLHVQLHGKGL